MPDSISDSISTTGRVTVGSSVTGEIETANDRDAYAVDLVAGRTYRIDLEGAATGKGTLVDPFLRWLRDSSGNGLHGTKDHDGGEGLNARQEFTPQVSGTYYISARGQGDGVGTYTLTVTDTTPVITTNAAPTFGQQGYTFDLAENTDGSTNRVSLGTVAATDPEGATLAYSLVGDSGSFEIDEATGEVFYTGSGEDHESGTTWFSLTVRASDGSEATDTTVTVNVTDVAEAPSFGQQGYTFDLAENTDGSTNRVSLGTVAATDPEGATLAYSLVGDSGSFEIDETTGEVFYTGSGEDYESGTASFSLTVRASDGSHTADTTVTINVTDVDEPVEVTEDTGSTTDTDAVRAGATDLGDITDLQGPRFPLGTVDGDADQVDYYRFTLTEAKEVGLGLRQQDANADLFLEDADGNVLYSSTNSGTTNEAIAETLLAGTYYLRVESQEAGVNAHVVRYGVSAPDADALAELQQQSVTAVNAAPTFGQQGYTFDLAENTDGSTNRVSLGTVAATDPEGATLAYSLVGDGGSFEIDATTGELFYTGSGEDYESGTTWFSLTVRASDGSEATDTTVTVNVTDVEETADPPAADEVTSTPQTVSEPDDEDFSANTSTGGRVVVGEMATGNIGSHRDRDWFEVELVAGREYQIDLRGSPTDDGTLSDPRLFGVHDVDGKLIARTTNDDWGGTYNSRVTFTATASGTHYVAAGAFGTNLGTYELEVTDKSPQAQQVVQQAPVFGSQSYAFDLAENTDGSTTRLSLGTVSATDGDNDTLTYSIESGNESGRFEIDTSTGELFYTGTGEDYESDTTSYSLTVRGSDGSLHADTTVTVNVTDVQEAPAFRWRHYILQRLPENIDGSTDRVSLGTVSATDADNDTLTYSIVDGNESGRFEIDTSSGEVFYIGTGEDYESSTTWYRLTVRASDGTRTADASVEVDVTNVDDGELKEYNPRAGSIARVAIDGGEGDDTLVGDHTIDYIFGGSGNDTISGNSSTDFLLGGSGNDTIDGGWGNDWIRGGSGDDIIRGAFGSDVILGDAGNDVIDGGKQDDIIIGGEGDDTLTGGSYGSDTFGFQGGHGSDTITDLDTSRDKIDLSAFDTSITFQQLEGKMSTVTDPSDSDTVTGIEIDLTEFGGGTIIVQGVTALAAGHFILPGSESSVDSILNFVPSENYGNVILGGTGGETIELGGVGDYVFGAEGNDTVSGGSGRDWLHGGEGNDALDGGAFPDILDGGEGDDTLIGGNGRDTLTGGAGDDTLTGGGREDFFVFSPRDGNDTITDFEDGTDKIILSGMSSTQDASGSAAMSSGISAFSDLTISQDDTDTVIDLSAHGGGQITLENFTSTDLDSTDFGLMM